MKRIIFTRHAETIENRTGILQGNNHTDFSEEGRANLRKLKKELDKYDFQLALSSDLPRCLKTANYILHQRKGIIRTEPLVREKSSGRFAGRATNQELWKSLRGSFERRKPLGGESLLETRRRAEKFAKLLLKLPEDRILVISHGGFLKVLFGMLLGKGLRESIFNLYVDHCSLTFLELSGEGKFEFKEFNETKHL